MNHIIVALLLVAYSLFNHQNTSMVSLITLAPGHFHAALVQKSMYDSVDATVHVYAPSGDDLDLHLERIKAYNNRAQKPTHWKEEVYTGDDYFEKLLVEKKGNVVVLAGNNRQKTDYILRSLQGGFNVLADKPMAINGHTFEMLEKAFETAQQKGLLLYDIMTERFEITSILQKELMKMPAVFGELEKGTAENPAVIIESGHCFYKSISGNVLTRPAWFMDEAQQGEGIVDVTTHLVDLVQWQCFPGQVLDYTKDIRVMAAKRWPTHLTRSQFNTVTRLEQFPAYLRKNLLNDTTLKVYSNGSFSYTLKGLHAKISVEWLYLSEGGNDTHYSMIRGTKANLVIRQNVAQKYKPALYIEPVNDAPGYEQTLLNHLKILEKKYSGIELRKTGQGWELLIPEKYKEGHEAHFARVTQHYLDYLRHKSLPAWEVPGMLAKYYTIIKALELAHETGGE